ncbi:uncharacterized protein LOC124914416 [Impatiens glandulifera]|uniref:uncharacterized protein LOC124914416 n=1 Tax=Impatiens glandulifera TaxID=253017 RepID=UPI001FB12395|nr:uncharacterized protein LOC124914416 [Impatiens glandulifera]
MDTNDQETLLQAGSTISELGINEMDSISNLVQDIDEREERFRKLENRISDYNENQSRTCFRETRSYTRLFSQFHSEGRYSGWLMMSNHSDVSNERWSRGNNRWGSSNWPSRYRDGYVPNTDWLSQNSRRGTYMSDRAFDSKPTDRYEYDRQYRVENTSWSNEGYRNGRYWSNATWSNGWHRHQIYGSHKTEDPTWHESYGNHRVEDMSWHNERNRQGRYGSLRVHRPGWANAHYRQGKTFSDRGENMSLCMESYRVGRHWNRPYSTRRRASSYIERFIAMLLLKDRENVKFSVLLPLAETSNLAVNLHEYRNIVLLPASKSQFSSRQPVSGEAAAEGMHIVKPISNGSVHSDLTTNDDTFSKKIGSGSCNIDGKSELETERSSELGNSDCKTISSFLKEEMSVMGERFENEQGQALEKRVSQSVEDNNLSLLGILSKENPCATLEADTYSCMADKPLDVLHPFPERPLAINSRRKLLILDINGLLADIISPPPKECKPDTCILRRAIFKRPFCYDFLKFCFERFHVGIWSSRAKKIIDRVVDYLLGSLKSKLVLCWDLSHCTSTKFRTLENRHKCVVFKELKKIWEYDDPSLPWKEGEYNASNTLLLDDSPYKALLNPMHSAIFPKSYSFKDIDDNSLGPEGDLRVYLENLAAADDIQKYIEQQPMGQKAIEETDCNWSFYSKVVSSVAASTKNESESSCMPLNTTEVMPPDGGSMTIY